MKKNYINIGLILFVLGFALFINVGSYGVVETSDARYAEIAREMFISADYIHPNLLNIHHYHKPPFTYQLTALAYHIFGINSFAARFFLQLSVLLQIWLVYKITFLLFSRKKIAVLSAVIYSSFPLVMISSRNLTTDSFLTSFLLLSIYSWLEYYKNGKTIFLYLFALSMGLGFYTKGPVIFIVSFVFMALYAYYFPQKKKFRLHHLLALVVFLIVGLWWYLYLAMENADFINYFLGKQTLDRFANNAFNRAEPWWYFLVLLPITAAPWLFILPFLIKDSISDFKKHSILKVLIYSILIPLFFFSLSTSKRILYILPFYVFIAILTAYFIDKADTKQKKKTLYFQSLFYLALILIVLGIKFILPDIQLPSYFYIFSLLNLILLFLVSFKFNFSIEYKLIFNSLIFSLFMLIASSIFMSKNPLLINSPKPLTDFIKTNNLEQREVYLYNSRQPSIAFELNKPIISLYKDSRDLNREVQFEQNDNWKKYLINLNLKNQKDSLVFSIQKKPSILITYKQTTKNSFIDSLKQKFHHQKNFKKYTLYY